MVCIYCGCKTKVYNSRHQKAGNNTWRRHRCLTCHAVFSSIESPAYSQAVLFKDAASHILPFSRDTLFVSVYEACRHRKHPITDAAALTNTIIIKLLPQQSINGLVTRYDLVCTVGETLRHFDAAAWSYYLAYHPLSEALDEPIA